MCTLFKVILLTCLYSLHWRFYQTVRLHIILVPGSCWGLLEQPVGHSVWWFLEFCGCKCGIVTTRHVNFADPFFCVSLSLLPWLWLTPQHRLRHVKSLLVRNLTLPDIFHSSHDALSVSVYFTLHSTHYPDKGTCSSFTEMTLINFELHVDLQSNAFFEQEVEATISFSYGGCFCFPDYFLTVTIADVTL